MDNKAVISGKKVFILLLVIFGIACLGFVLLVLGVEFGRYIAIISVIAGAIITMSCSVLAMIGWIEKDF